MKSILTMIFLLVLSVCCRSTSLPDSIVIHDYSWSMMESFNYQYVLVRGSAKFNLYQTYSKEKDRKGVREHPKRRIITSVSLERINQLVVSIGDNEISELKLEHFGYNQKWIESHEKKLFNYIKKENDHWTKEQIRFTKQELKKTDNYTLAIKRGVLKEGIYYLSKHGGTEFKAILYYGYGRKSEVIASENPFGLPWQIDGKESLNLEISKQFAAFLPKNKGWNKRRLSEFNNLLSELVEQIFYDVCRDRMDELASLEFDSDIEVLKTKYQVSGFKEYAFRDQYIWDDDQVFIMTLKDTTMLPNVSINLYLSRKRRMIYTRDSIMAHGQRLIQMIQSKSYLNKYLIENPTRKLIVNFYNGSSINDEIISGFNKSPDEWVKYENDVKRWQWIDSMGMEISVDRDEALRTSKSIYCGCNFHLDNKYLKRGIYFQIFNEFDERSDWIMLPDQTVVLWFFQGRRVYNYDYEDLLTRGISVQDVCKKLTDNGEIKIE